MSFTRSENEQRQERILDAAADVIIRYGYDKTTMSDIAAEAGVTRAILYLHFDSKEQLFEALLYRETRQYTAAWLKAIQADPQGGTLAGVFRSVLAAVDRSPFLSAMLKQDRRVFGQYLRKPGNLFESLQSASIWRDTLQELQAVGAIRADVRPAVMAHVMNALSLGLLASQDYPSLEEPPPFEDILETVALMLERTLTPEDGGNRAAGQAILQRIASAASSSFNPSSEPASHEP